MMDVHAHFIPQAVLQWLKDHPDRVSARWETRDPNREPFLVIEGKWAFELKKAFSDEEGFLAAQEAAGVDHSLVSPVPQFFLYDQHPEVTAEAATVYNDALMSFAGRHPDRLSALATVPLNDGEAAAAELERAMDRGMRGAIIGPGFGGLLLSDDRFRPFWEAADARRAIVFLHPLLNDDPRLKRRQMPNMIGVPWETTISAVDLILSGMLDRFPQVRIVLAHGGGFLPYQIGRIDKGYEQWAAVRADLQAPPGEYLRRFWYDTVLWNERALHCLADLVGDDRLVPGSDYPFDLSAWPPAAARAAGQSSLMA